MKSALTGHGIFCHAGQYTRELRVMHVEDVKLRDQWCQYLPLKHICNKMCHLGPLQRPLGKVARATMKQNLIRASRPMNVQCVTLSQLASFIYLFTVIYIAHFP